MYIFLSAIKLQMWGMLVGDVGGGSTCDSWGWLGGKRVVSALSPGCSGVYMNLHVANGVQLYTYIVPGPRF